MNFTKLENEKFKVKYSSKKPHNKHFPNSRIDIINETEYKFSSLLTKEEMTINISYPQNKNFRNIIWTFINKFSEFHVHNNNSYSYSCLYNHDLLVFSCTNNYLCNFDFPVKVNLNNTETKSFHNKMYPINFNNIYIVACKSYMFEMVYRLMKLDHVIQLSKKEIELFDKLDPNKLYDDEFLDDNNIEHNNIIYNNGLINIPIFEKLGENWIFYQHNYDKYKDQLKEQ